MVIEAGASPQALHWIIRLDHSVTDAAFRWYKAINCMLNVVTRPA